MNRVRLLLTIAVIAVLSTFSGFFIHAIWLKQDYMVVSQLYRPEDQMKMLFIIMAYVSFAVGSVWVYAHGVESNKPVLGQGVRFGVLMFLILAVPSFFIAYAVQPIPAVLFSKQVLSELANKVLLGVVTALVYGKARLGTSSGAL